MNKASTPICSNVMTLSVRLSRIRSVLAVIVSAVFALPFTFFPFFIPSRESRILLASLFNLSCKALSSMRSIASSKSSIRFWIYAFFLSSLSGINAMNDCGTTIASKSPVAIRLNSLVLLSALRSSFVGDRILAEGYSL